MESELHLLFALRSYGHLYLIRSAIREAAAAGHRVSVLFHQGLTDETLDDINKFEGEHPNITYGWTKSSRRAGTPVFHSREVLTYRKHLLKGSSAKYYIGRWKNQLHPKLQKFFDWSWARTLLKTVPVGFLLRLVEKLTPPQQDVLKHLRELKPDVLIATPVNKRRSSMELEYLKAAVYLRIPSVIAVTSWDTITSKGLYHICPDRFLVWNEVHRAEAISHQGMPPERIKVVGSPTFDHWFLFWQAAPRGEFFKKWGLNPEYPMLAYLCSSTLVAGDEALVIRNLRKVFDEARDERIRRMQIIVKPYPDNWDVCENLNLKDTAVIPRGGLAEPSLSQQLLYDIIYHSVAFMGINTTAILDAIVLGKPVISPRSKAYEERQLGTFHFQAVYKEGVLDLVDIENEKEDFYKILIDLLEGRDRRKEKRAAFIKRYIRPRGLEMSAGEAILEEIEKLVWEKPNF